MIKIFVGKVVAPASGQWFDLSDYVDSESLQDAIYELHGDDETIISDSEGLKIPELASIDDVYTCYEAINDCHNSAAMIAYIEHLGFNYYQEAIDNFDDAYCGEYDSGADFAEQTATDCEYIPKDLASWIVIDWQASWDCNLRYDYMQLGNYFFRNV